MSVIFFFLRKRRDNIKFNENNKTDTTRTRPGPGPTEGAYGCGGDNNQFLLPKCTREDEIDDGSRTLRRFSRETIDLRIRLCHSDGVDAVTPLLVLIARSSLPFRRASASNCARVTSATQRSKSCWGNCHSPKTTGCKSCVTWTVM